MGWLKDSRKKTIQVGSRWNSRRVVDTFSGAEHREQREKTWLIHQSAEQIITDSAREDRAMLVENGTGGVNKKYVVCIDRHWWGRFFEVPERGPPVVYVPIPSESLGPTHGLINSINIENYS